MAMRYIIRRDNPENIAELKKEIPELDKKLDKASDGMKRSFQIPVSNLERINYLFLTKKKGSDWIWICPSIELVAENETSLFALMKRFSLSAPAHLAHLENPQST